MGAIPSESSSSSATATSGNNVGPVGFGDVTFGATSAAGSNTTLYLVIAGLVAIAGFFFLHKK